jgi:diguanylate cyclase (GGDEF)-like protein
VTPISSSSHDAAGSSGRRPDFSTRFKGRLRTLRTRLDSRDARFQAWREAHATLEPERVAAWLTQQMEGWVPAPCWVVVVPDAAGQPVVLGERGLTPELGTAVSTLLSWVMRNGAELFSADLACDNRAGIGEQGTAAAFPLSCRGRTVGVLVALDPAPSSAAPGVSPALLETLRQFLEPVALALDNALTLQRAEALAVIDDLTRLYNSRFLHQALRRESKRALRQGRPMSLLFVDLDGFKQINDTYGHLAGSKALVEVGAVLRGSARETDVVARFGGDEFALVLPETNLEGALAVAARLRNRLATTRFLASDGASVQLTASIGVATLPDAAGSAEELLRAADKAMYRVKASGKDGIQAAQGEERPVSPGQDSRS